jgi:hypothetical protein
MLPRVVDEMAKRWNANKEQLVAYARKEINLAQLYTAMNSPAGGKWLDDEMIADLADRSREEDRNNRLSIPIRM